MTEDEKYYSNQDVISLEYQQRYFMLRKVGDYWKRAKERAAKGAIKTGFNSLDKLLNGGLYSGLYLIGGGTSVGKTAFMLQLADQIAAGGHDVLYLSLEMATDELLARSFSRLSYLANKPLKMIEAYLYKGFDRTDNEVEQIMSEVFDTYYSVIAPHMYIYEGSSSTSAADIVELVKMHQAAAPIPMSPVIILDYLQLVAPNPYINSNGEKVYPNLTDKQRLDRVTNELKVLSRDLETPIITVSSYARDKYDKSAELNSFKETGTLEYTADVAIGLQVKGTGINSQSFDCEQQKEALNNGKDGALELCILKNRRGRKRVKCALTANYAYNIMIDRGIIEGGDQ